jgi:large subunit ribosomal protein L29
MAKDNAYTIDKLKGFSDAEIVATVAELRRKIYDLRVQKTTEKVENTAQFINVRRDIARLLTEQSARRLKANPKPVRTRRVEEATKPAARTPKAPPGTPSKPKRVRGRAKARARATAKA